MGLTQLSQFHADNGKVYTNTTSFMEMADAKKVDGSNMPDAINGRFGGEVMNMQMVGNVAKITIVSYPLDKQGNRNTLPDGTPVEPDVVTFEVHNPDLIQQFQSQVQVGMNIEVGYRYFNKADVVYDEFGFPEGSGETIERTEVAKLMIHGQGGQQSPNPQGNQMGTFGQGAPNNQQSPGFGQQQQQGQNGGFGQQQQQQQNPGFGQQQQQQQQPNNFGGFNGQVLNENDPLAQQANQIFGNNGQNGNGFNFGR